MSASETVSDTGTTLPEGSMVVDRALARELADAMLQGVERRLAWPVPTMPQDEMLASLAELNVPATAKAGAFSGLVRRLRAVVGYFVRPWLARQGDFNRAVVQQLRDHHDGSQEIDLAIQTLQGELLRLPRELAQLGTTERAFNSQLGRDGLLDAAGLRYASGVAGEIINGQARLKAVESRVIEHPWILTRLARLVGETGPVAVLGAAGESLPLELAGLGYDVDAIDHQHEVRPLAVSHGRLTLHKAQGVSLPLASGRCAAAVVCQRLGQPGWTDDEGREAGLLSELVRIVRPGGYVLITVPAGRHRQRGPHVSIYDQASVRRLISEPPAGVSWQVSECRLAHQASPTQSWQLLETDQDLTGAWPLSETKTDVADGVVLLALRLSGTD